MADFTAPFHAPKFTTAEFKEMKRKYVAKHGYAVTFPAWDDIIHVMKFTPMTDREKKLWSQRRYNEIEPGRRAEIREWKEKKRKKFLAMLSDPSPEIALSAGAILTAIDDIQDSVSTLACIGMIGAAVIGGPVAAAVLGPLGLILAASEFMNIINPYSHLRKLLRQGQTGRGAKKLLEKHTDKNPFSKKAKVNLAKKLKKFRPTIGNACEALQTTDQIFGIGICLGPVIGFAQSFLSGTVRAVMGEKVTFGEDLPTSPEHLSPAAKAAIANSLLHSSNWQSDADDEMLSILAANVSLQTLYPTLQEWNPIDHVKNLENYLVEAPRPTDPLTLEIIAEEGIPVDAVCVWPQNGKRLLSIADIQESVLERAAPNLKHYAEQNRHSLEAFNALAAADDFALNFLATMEGPDQIRIDYLRTERIVITILDNGWMYPEDITEPQVQKFEDWVYVHEYMDTSPRAKDIWNYAKVFCGFEWVRPPDEFR